MDRKPVISYAGDRKLFMRLEAGLVASLPNDSVEWKRSYGRSSKSVHVDVDFQPFNAEQLIQGRTSLQGQHILHTYWTDCCDVDTYKVSLREEIIGWHNTLKKAGSSSDWLIVIVENNDTKKGNKLLPRTTVLDRMKQDLGSKSTDRCLTLLEQSKPDSKTTESMHNLLQKIRYFFLQSYNRSLNRYEELIRAEREKRNDLGWNFCQYFLLQEQLAFVYEIMGLQDEALVQYDELDALLTQFVVNCSVGVCPPWLSAFSPSLQDWTGFSLNRNINHRLRAKLERRELSLLDMRNYLFARQALLLLQLNQPYQVARRCLGFLHNTLQELRILEVECAEGSTDCWVVLCCLEVLTLPQCSPHGGEHGLYTGPLWEYATKKLLQLGRLCGLMPKQTTDSNQLHLVVSLFGGLKEDMYLKLEANEKNPAERLKETLSSKAAFQKNYLEMTEIAISTFKHIGRIRSARLLGRDLATFYLELGQVQQAATFLQDVLKTFQHESWDRLCVETLLELAHCYKSLEDEDRYMRTCIQLASCQAAEKELQEKYFDEVIAKFGAAADATPPPPSANGGPTDDLVICSGDEIISFVSCSLVRDNEEQKIVPGNQLTFNVQLMSHLPKTVTCDAIELSLAFKPHQEKKPDAERKLSKKTVQRSPSAVSTSTLHEETDDGSPEDTSRLILVESLEYKQDRSLQSARIVCRNAGKVLKRKDSSGTILKDGQLKLADYSSSLKAGKLEIKPGVQTIQLVATAGQQGQYCLTQLCVRVRKLTLVQNLEPPVSAFTVMVEMPSISLNREGELFTGIENKMVVSVHCGSMAIPDGSHIDLTASRGLLMKADNSEGSDYSREISVRLPAGQPFQTLQVDVWVYGELRNQKDSTAQTMTVSLSNPWTGAMQDVHLHLIPGFYTTFALLTALSNKFLQITVHPLYNGSAFQLKNCKLTITNQEQVEHLALTSMSSPDQILTVRKQLEGSYLWQLNIEELETIPEVAVKLQLCIDYRVLGQSDEWTTYSGLFQFQDYNTLFTVQAKVDPAKGNEFCRASTLCPMTIQVEQLNPTQNSSLYYEVIADQTQWAVCGKQGAVINMEQTRRHNIIVEVMPLCGGALPLPAVRLSKYIPADGRSDGHPAGARLDPFAPGQVYNRSRAQQIHVLPPASHQAEYVSLP